MKKFSTDKTRPDAGLYPKLQVTLVQNIFLPSYVGETLWLTHSDWLLVSGASELLSSSHVYFSCWKSQVAMTTESQQSIHRQVPPLDCCCESIFSIDTWDSWSIVNKILYWKIVRIGSFGNRKKRIWPEFKINIWSF